MKTVAVGNPSAETKRLLDRARKEDLILKTSDGEEFLLSPVDDFGYEVAAQRRNKKLMDFLDKRFREARAGDSIPLDEAWRQLSTMSTKKRQNGMRRPKGHIQNSQRPARRGR